ncbi:hypothetical protein LI053_07840 [Clostridium perfringens]|uniref:hypothetical protein n=3 Tax=Clostridium perfringens TaxID=1502 RepID=UPI0013E368E4|nr:hypothetical protein [Clostridium perfringens]MCX0385372.1 hypothetical protein [Clostridium perfringens]MDT7930528.1 hypothetical protein [Clostridium perfringens]MDT7954016.1 hypothetical protein [Clostridium perfringens]
MRVNRKDVKGNTLKKVITRIDFEDLFGISPNVKKEIRSIANKYNIDKQMVRFLNESDFVSDDKFSIVSYPYEYIKDIESLCFYNEELTFAIELNQLFLTITQDVNENYLNYGITLKILSKILNSLNIDNDDLIIMKKISIKKSNAAFFESITSMIEIFDKDNLAITMENTDDFEESMFIKKLKEEDILINVKRIIDKGILEGKELYRLYFEFYASNNKNIDIENVMEKIEILNSKIFKQYESCFTSEGIESVKDGKKIGVI